MKNHSFLRSKVFQYAIAPLLNVAFLIILYALIEYGFLPRTGFWGFIPVIIGSWVAGIFGGVVSGGMWAIFGYAIIPGAEFSRFLTLAVGGVVTGFFMGYFRQQEWKTKKELKHSLRREKAARIEVERNQIAKGIVRDLRRELEGDKVELNGMLTLLETIEKDLRILLRDVAGLHKQIIEDRIRRIIHNVVNLATGVGGWAKLDEIRTSILKEKGGVSNDDIN